MYNAELDQTCVRIKQMRHKHFNNTELLFLTVVGMIKIAAHGGALQALRYYDKHSADRWRQGGNVL